MKKYLALFAIMAIGGQLAAQNLPQFSFHMFNRQVYNPGFVGSDGRMSVAFAGRQQWVGQEGSPNSYVLALNTPLGKTSSLPRLAAGFLAMRDEIGVRETHRFKGQIAYRIPFGNRTVLSFGIQMSGAFVNQNLANLDVNDPNDPLADENYQSGLLPNSGFGVYYYSDDFFVGASISDWFGNSLQDVVVVDNPRGYHLQGGYRFHLNDNLDLRPTTMIRYTGKLDGINSPLEVDVNLALIIQNQLMIGLNHRVNESVGAMLKYQFSENLYAGYAYDFTVTNYLKQSRGSHEVLLGYVFNINPKGVNSPRFITYF